jgi:CubicO group peptidase (beta-lactamase class C family)
LRAAEFKWRATVGVRANQGAQMTRMFLICIGLLVSFAATAADVSDREFIAGYAKQHQFNGTVLIERKGEVQLVSSFGLANIAFGVPDSRDTEYKIASITKLFTSVLILQLYEQGKLDLHATIATYLPQYAGEAANKVTIHQLLNHTSGIYNMDQVKSMQQALEGGVPPYQFPYTSDQMLEKFASGKLVSAPGAAFSYNNGDYIILGKIIEHVCGKSYETVLTDNILAPLHLMHTGLLRQDMTVPRLADTYFYRDDIKRLVPDLPVYPENWYAAGALYSTVDDVRLFADALFGLKLIKRDTLEQMIKPGLDGYGYGLWAYDAEVGGKKFRVVKRPGQIMGAQAQLYHFLDQDITVVILSNTGTTDLDDFVKVIGERMVR